MMAAVLKGSSIEVSHSKAKTWRRCHAQYDYKYNQRLEKKKPLLPLLRGRIVGECLDLVAVGGNWEAILKAHAKVYKKLFDEEKEYYGDIIGDVRRIIQGYVQLYAKDGLTYFAPKGLDPYEIKVRVDLGGGVIFKGKIDKYPKDKQGRYWVMDHKSHKNIPDEDARFPDLQLVQYHWAAPQIGLPAPSGVLWDYVRTKTPTVPKLLKDGSLSQRDIDTTYEVYLQAIKDNKLKEKDYKDILAALKKEGPVNYYRRVWLPSPNKSLVANVVNDLRSTAIEIREFGSVSKVRSMDRTCKQCQYYQLCQAEVRGLDADFIRKTEYKVKVEEPSDAEEEAVE